MYESKDKMVSHPDHYQSSKGIEVIDCIEAFTEGLDGIEATDTGNIIKYACRWKKKNGIQDIEKIIWYAQHLIDHLDKKKLKERGDDTVSDSQVYSSRQHLGDSYRCPHMATVWFDSEDDAKKAYNSLLDKLKKYAWVTIRDYYNTKVAEFADLANEHKYGWYELDPDVNKVVKKAGGVDMWYLDLPWPVLLLKNVEKPVRFA
jgi:hypothetical protein